LKENFESFVSFNCIYPDSLTGSIFKQALKSNDISHFDGDNRLSKDDKDFFQDLVPWVKMQVYASGQQVNIDPSLEKAFYLSARKNDCSLAYFEEKGRLSEELRLHARLEILLRSRFMIAGRSSQTSRVEAINSAKNFQESIGKQIDSEVYW
jgi:hypothetical protein